MTDLETAIRDALRSRADEVPIRHTSIVRRRRRWVSPVLAAALVIALVALTLVLFARSDSTTRPAAPKISSFVGYSWRLTQIDDRQGRLTLPASTKAEVEFPRGGHMTGSDTVHALDAHYRLVPGGYEPHGLAESGNGLAGRVSATLKRTMAAMRSCFSSVQLDSKPPAIEPVRAAVSGDHLVLHTTVGVLTFVRGGVVIELHG